MTSKELNKYVLGNGGARCPNCDSDAFIVRSTPDKDPELGFLKIEVSCEDGCGARWIETYVLTDVVEEKS